MIPALPRSKVVGDMDVVVFLLNVGADKDLTNGAHHPSCAACVGGSEPVVATLLQAGADSDIGAPLWIAHRAGNDLLVQVLLDHRANHRCEHRTDSATFSGGGGGGGGGAGVLKRRPIGLLIYLEVHR